MNLGLLHRCCMVVVLLCRTADAVILAESGDVAHHTSSPGDNSGWQYEGRFLKCLGVPIGPHHFITAAHIGGSEGDVFFLHDDSYTTIGFTDVSADLRIWEVNHGKPFPTYAPLSSGVADIGATAMVIGRGTRRGAPIVVNGEPKGWGWGGEDGVQRWGRNVIEGTTGSPEMLYCNFDQNGVSGECHLSVADSGGGVFVLEGGLWRLAGINFSVDGPFRVPPAGGEFFAALYDMGGLEYEDPADVWNPVADEEQNLPSRFYAWRISTVLPAITNIVPQAAALAPESYSAWCKLYFTPAQMADPARSGADADFDGDGIANLLEFALNLDPVFAGSVTMVPGTGLCGLPVVGLESSAGGERLTVEFVRRGAASGAGLEYVVEYSSDLETWQAGGQAAVTAINPRWDRVKVSDDLTTGQGTRRFARLRVSE